MSGNERRVRLVPVPHAVAAAVCSGHPVTAALAELHLQAGPGWPAADTGDALRPHADHGAGVAKGTFLIVADDGCATVIGECGWFGPPDPGGNVEIGYGLAPQARGRGLATEAVASLCAWAECQPGVRRLTAEALVGNDSSRRLLARLGFDEVDQGPRHVRYARAVR